MVEGNLSTRVSLPGQNFDRIATFGIFRGISSAVHGEVKLVLFCFILQR